MDATEEKAYDISILVPFYNEEENIVENYQNINAAIKGIQRSIEIIYVNDGSRDGGLALLKEATKDDARVKIITFVRNFGQTAAMEAAFKAADGKTYITLDADNQNDPNDIPALLAKMDEGYDVVSGWREKRKDGFILRRLPSILANWLISKVTGVKLKDYGCTLKAYNSFYLDHVNLYGEMHRFIPAYAKYAGAKITEVSVNHRARTKGVSKYGIERTFKVLLDLITVKFLGDYATKPIYFFGKLSFMLMLTSIAIAGFVLYQKFVWEPAVFVHRNPLFNLSLFILTLSVVIIMMGVLAEMIMRTYHESQDKKPYRIKEIVGGNNKDVLKQNSEPLRITKNS
jgi:glycosyltransferase involved in cell wall biosynthesis